MISRGWKLDRQLLPMASATAGDGCCADHFLQLGYLMARGGMKELVEEFKSCLSA
jgi:hypothetical protein